jgi:predicted DNA-binding protein (UPF0251 family)
MLRLHPEVLKRDGKKQFVILPYEEFEAIREAMEDLEDLRDLRDAKAKEVHFQGIPFAEVQRRLREKGKRKKRAG